MTRALLYFLADVNFRDSGNQSILTIPNRLDDKLNGDPMNRRQLLFGAGAGLAAGATPLVAATMSPSAKPKQAEDDSGCHGGTLKLCAYEPASMLEVEKTDVPRARYPLIDTHTHITFSAVVKSGVSLSSKRNFIATPQQLLPIMDQRNVRAMVDLTGGYGEGLKETVARYQKACPGRFYIFTEPSYERFLEPNYPKLQADAIEQSYRDGAKGLKILKTLGLYLRENITTGRLVKIDDPRFDPMWDACGQMNIPVAMHISDPAAFFTPVDRFNERYEELHDHPNWSFYGGGFPAKKDLIAARNRVIARHPKTRFVGLHVANYSVNLASVSETLDRYPNLTVDIAARISELGRQPRATRKFFDKYQDRIVFGTDAAPEDPDFFGAMYPYYFRFLETADEYFPYAPTKTPPQGRWNISGIELPDTILRKVYYENAERELGIKA